ncbi:MAG: hypothetical protein M1839_003997 [Geoglossum umbratile]|nr:MAG: hypothetical protein M1839_003997 [Geoglossum umbratile]
MPSERSTTPGSGLWWTPCHFFLTLTYAAIATAAVLRSREQMTNLTITVPIGTTTHGDPHLLCMPGKWNDIIIFYLGNFLAHAATVRQYPGEQPYNIALGLMTALIFPSGGALRGLNAVLRSAAYKIGPRGLPNQTEPLERAARAGALCMVVRSRFWKPEEGDTPRDIILKKTQDKSNDWHGTSESEGHRIKIYTPPWLRECTRFWWFSDKNLGGPRQRRIHGSCELPGSKSPRRSQHYTLACVPRKAIVEFKLLERKKRSRKIEDTLKSGVTIGGQESTEDHIRMEGMQGRGAPSPLPGGQIAGSPEGFPGVKLVQVPNDIASTLTPPKILVAIIQVLYATVTLYRSRGNQIDQYGYAAFGLTVAPYAIMSIINLAGQLVTPDYPAMYLVWSEVMGEAIERGAKISAVAGTLLEDMDSSAISATPSAQYEEPLLGTFHKFPKDSGDGGDTFSLEISSDRQTPGDKETKPAKDILAFTSRKHNAPVMYIPSCQRFARTDDPKTNVINPDEEEDPTRKRLLTSICGSLAVGAASLIIIAIFSHFHPGSSTKSQRIWTMMWLAFGTFFQLVLQILLVISSKLKSESKRQKPQEVTAGEVSISGKRIVFYFVISFLTLFIYAVPAIGGLVVVGQMIQNYGTCTRFD